MPISKQWLGAVAVLAGFLAACGTTGGATGDATGGASSETAGWRKITQIENRTGAYVTYPAARTGDLAVFKLAFVYAPGQIMWENKPVAWQVYEQVIIDCAKNEVKLGKRTRYDESGAAMMSDEDPNFAGVVWGTVAADAEAAVCDGRFWVDGFGAPDRGGWQTQARANLASTTPGQRPPGFHD